MKSAQAGFTEVGINLALFYVDVMKRNVLYVLPTLTDASDFSKSRFNPALKMSLAYLKSVFTDTNNVGLKMAGSISLYIRGSRGDSNLKSIPVSILILDELDEMDQSQIELAMQRVRGQPEKKVWYIWPGSRLHRSPAKTYRWTPYAATRPATRPRWLATVTAMQRRPRRPRDGFRGPTDNGTDKG